MRGAAPLGCVMIEMEKRPAISVRNLLRFARASQDQEHAGRDQTHHCVSRRHGTCVQFRERNREETPTLYTGPGPFLLVAELEFPCPRQMIDLDPAMFVVLSS